MKLRIGVIGQSRDWKTVYGPLLMQMRDRYEVRSVYNSVSALADQVAHQFDADNESSFRSMVARPDIDAVIALESDWYGALPIYAACEAGKAIYCGADVHLDAPTMDEIRQRVTASGVAFVSELHRRYAPATIRLKELIATRLGRPRLLFCHRRLPNDINEVEKSATALQARAQRELIELVDWCRYLVDEEPSWVQVFDTHLTRTHRCRIIKLFHLDSAIPNGAATLCSHKFLAAHICRHNGTKQSPFDRLRQSKFVAPMAWPS